MAKKGSKYAQKHTKYLTIGCANKGGQLEDENAIFEVIYDNVSFLKTFNYLPLNEKIKTYQVLKNLSEAFNHNMSKEEKELARESRNKLQKINELAGLCHEEMLRYPLSPDEHHIIRLDCYGTVDRRLPHQLSIFYKDLLKHPLPYRPKPKEYDFSQAPAWKLFRQFKNFRNIEQDLQLYLAQNRINPQILEVMGVRDFSDLIFNVFKKDENQYKVSFVNCDSERNAFVKALAREKGAEIAQILNSHDIDPRYTASLLNAMRMYGVTEADKIIITETHFNQRILHDLAKDGIVCGHYRIDDKIPQDLTEYLVSKNKESLLAARDENGELLKGSAFPSFEVHHKVAVSESGRLPYVAAVNYRDNFVLVESSIHKYVLHGYDKLMVADGKEAYRSRMEFKTPHVAFMFGFTPEEQLTCDWSNTIEYQNRVEQDNSYLVSYEDIIVKLEENRARFSKKSKSSPQMDVKTVVSIVRHKFADGKAIKQNLKGRTSR